ncbi:MAG: RNA polymerase sigma factor [Verrucomicrobiales bacterium]
MADEDDKELMSRLREGDDLALNDLMRRWKEPVVTFSLRYTGNLTDATEIAQETFVRVYQARHRYRPEDEAAFSSWLFRIATNLCRMRHRWKKRHPEVLAADRDGSTQRQDPDGDDLGSPEKMLDRRTLAADLDAAIQRLAPDLKAAFILQELQGKSQTEIAAIQNCSPKAVERRLARARERLREILHVDWSCES